MPGVEPHLPTVAQSGGDAVDRQVNPGNDIVIAVAGAIPLQELDLHVIRTACSPAQLGQCAICSIAMASKTRVWSFSISKACMYVLMLLYDLIASVLGTRNLASGIVVTTERSPR